MPAGALQEGLNALREAYPPGRGVPVPCSFQLGRAKVSQRGVTHLARLVLDLAGRN